MNGLRITQSNVGDHLVLALEGELSVLSSFAFSKTVDEHIRQNNVLKVVLDVGELALIDSNGLGTIAKLYEELRLLGGCIHLARIRANLLEMLYAAKLDKSLTWHKTVDEAVAACAGAASVPAAAKTDPLGGPVTAKPDPLGGPVELKRDPLGGPVPVPPAAEQKPPAIKSAPKLDESEFGMLPEHEGCTNYPTWFAIHWLSTHEDVRQQASAVLERSADADSAAAELYKLVGQHAASAVDQSSVVAGLSSFALRFVDWQDVVRKMRSKQGL